MKNNGNCKYTTAKTGFLLNEKGGSSVQFALIIGAVAIVSALAVPLAIEGNSQLAAFDRQNIDTVITGSIKQKKRYRIRRSILDIEQTK